jgi:hypothetical protein
VSQAAFFAARMNEWRMFITWSFPDLATNGSFERGVSGVTREVQVRYRYAIGPRERCDK